MLLWSVVVGILGVCGTGAWVTYLSRQRTQYGLQGYWFYGLVALLPAWLLACLSLLTPPAGGVQVFLPTAVLFSSAAGLLGVIGTDAEELTRRMARDLLDRMQLQIYESRIQSVLDELGGPVAGRR